MNRNIAMIIILAVSAGAVMAQETKTSWADSIKLKGDVRVRYEDIDEEGKTQRQRDRYRARLAADAKANDQVKVQIGLVTGDVDPVSGNQSMDEGFSKKKFQLDYAQIYWAVAEKVTVIGGKMKNPLHTSTDLIWDGDLTPEGFAVKAATGGDFNMMANAGYFWVNEISGSKDDIKLLCAELVASFKVTDSAKALIGFGYYGYDNIKGAGLGDVNFEDKAFGNSTVENADGDKVFASDYALTSVFGELSTKIVLPVSIKAHYVSNGDADDNDTGYQVGFKVGEVKDVGSAEFGYSYVELEKDAVFGGFTDSDRWGGGTDGKGHKIGATYQIAKNLKCGATYFINDKGLDKSKDYKRLQLDLVAKF